MGSRYRLLSATCAALGLALALPTCTRATVLVDGHEAVAGELLVRGLPGVPFVEPTASPSATHGRPGAGTMIRA